MPVKMSTRAFTGHKFAILSCQDTGVREQIDFGALQTETP
jgi:hypothetical protein